MTLLRRDLFDVTLILVMLAVLPGCLTVSNRQDLVSNDHAIALFRTKTIAVLPTRAQTSLAPDSVAAIRNEINKRIVPVLRSKLQSARIIDVIAVTNQLNVNNKMASLQEFYTSYEGTGVVDTRLVSDIGAALPADFVLFSRLKAEKMDTLLSQGMGTSLEVTIIRATNGDVVWSGAGEWKKGGMFGLGRATPDTVATSLINLATESLGPTASQSVGETSVNSSGDDTLHEDHQTQAPLRPIPTSFPKDPSLNYAGAICEPFTKPAPPGGGAVYSTGSIVVYGKLAYRCEAQGDRKIWTVYGPKTKLGKSWKQYEASRLEN